MSIKMHAIYLLTCETCNSKFESEYDLLTILPRKMKIECSPCFNKRVNKKAINIFHNLLDKLFEKVGIK